MTRRHLSLALCVLTSTVVASGLRPRNALADASAWQVVETRPGEPDEKNKNPPPQVVVKVFGEPAPKPDELGKWLLKQTDVKLKGVAPIKRIPFHQSNESLAVVVLVEGHEYYFGNDKYVEEAPPP